MFSLPLKRIFAIRGLNSFVAGSAGTDYAVVTQRPKEIIAITNEAISLYPLDRSDCAAIASSRSRTIS